MRALIVSLALAAGVLATAPGALADDGVSSNWAGYAAHGASFRTVSATWRQPGVTCARGQATYSAYWVGLGGYSAGSQALEQIGTEADCRGGRPELTAWFEMVPAPSMPVGMAVDAGDQMQASVTVSGHLATLALTNATRRRTFRASVWSRPIDISSAEWIVEAPSECASICTTLPLANFGTASFTGARAQLTGGYLGAISDRHWATTRLRLNPGAGQLASTRTAGGAIVSGLSWGDSVFSVSYARAGGPGSSFWLRRASARLARVVHPLRTGALFAGQQA